MAMVKMAVRRVSTRTTPMNFAKGYRLLSAGQLRLGRHNRRALARSSDMQRIGCRDCARPVRDARTGAWSATALNQRLHGPRPARRASCSSSAYRSEEHTYELQSLMRSSYAVFCLKKKKTNKNNTRSCTTQTKKKIT